MSKNLRVMLIDDHPLQLLSLERDFRALGVSYIYPFTDARMGLKAFNSQELNEIDIVICDLMMPEYDGVETMLGLNQLGYKGQVVLLSAAEDSVLDCVRSMCASFSFSVIAELKKPAQQDALSEILVEAKELRLKQSDGTWKNPPDIKDEEFLFALAEGQVKNYYQPLVSFEDRSLVGVEALARWYHPVHGTLAPNVFIPIVERCGLFQELFDAVCNNALDDIANGKLNVQVSLNVDHHNLIDLDFANNFISLCEEKGVDPSQLTIEITERDTYQNEMALYKNLSQLRLHDVSIAIDDFGTGYSSLEKLASLPFNELKIDRSFVSHLSGEGKNDQIVASICHLGKAMKLQLVAEGVEDEATWKILRKHQVDICQGFYIDKPMPLEALTILSK